MKRFNILINEQMLKLLEALPQDGGPVVDQNPSAPDEPKRSTPQEKSNWEMTLLDVAKAAIYNIKNDPESLSIEDEEKLGLDVTAENKDEMLDLIFKLAGKPRQPTMPIPEPEPTPEPTPEPVSKGKIEKPTAAKAAKSSTLD